jgi:DNA-binding transcriptional LysR family regulator
MFSRFLAPFGYAVYASPAYLAAKGKPRGDDFAGHDLVGIDDSVGDPPEKQWMRRHARQARVVLRSNNTYALLRAAVAGIGLTVLPCYLAAGQDLVRVVPPEEVAVKELWLVLHKDLRGAARIRAIVDFLVEAHAKQRLLLAGSAKAARRAP